MILEALIISLLIIYFTRESFEKIWNMKFISTGFALGGVFILLAINFFTTRDFGSISYFLVETYFYFHLLGLALVFLFIIVNYKKRGMTLIGFGLLLNMLAIMFNGKMPVSLKALERVGNLRTLQIIEGGKSLSHGIFQNPKIFFLGDIIPLTKPYIMPKVISLGDIIISIGIIITLVMISRR